MIPSILPSKMDEKGASQCHSFGLQLWTKTSESSGVRRKNKHHVED